MTATNFRDLLDPWALFVAGDGRSGLRVANADQLLARPVPWVDCPTCKGHGRVGCPGPGQSRARTQMERDALGLRKGIDYCYGMHMGHPCPACNGTGKATVAQLLAWGSAVAEPIESPRFPGDDKYDDVADYRNQILGVQP